MLCGVTMCYIELVVGFVVLVHTQEFADRLGTAWKQQNNNHLGPSTCCLPGPALLYSMYIAIFPELRSESCEPMDLRGANVAGIDLNGMEAQQQGDASGGYLVPIYLAKLASQRRKNIQRMQPTKEHVQDENG